MAASVHLKNFPFEEQAQCPQCLKNFTLYDAQGCEVVVCQNCMSYLHFNHTSLKYQVKEKLKPLQYTPVLPLGSKGTLKDFPYKVIAYMEKKEVDTGYEWREYMLYNYEKGYAFLAEYNGNWSLIAGKDHYPILDKIEDDDDDGVSLDGISYSLYNKYTPAITGLIGEYDWDVLNERINASEYILPPYLITKETSLRDHQTDYYLGQYIKAQEIAEAFNVPLENFPEKSEVGANEPSPYMHRWANILKVTGLLIVLVMVIQILLVVLRPEKNLLDSSFNFGLQTLGAADSLKNAYSGTYEMKSFRTPTFVVDNGTVPLDVEISSPVDNNWFESTIELVSEKDNQTWNLTKEIEYYHGYEDGESWSEGGSTAETTISSIPQGKYHLNIYPYAGAPNINQMNIKVTESEVLWRNILVTVLILLIYPIYCWYKMRRFETN
ncbi:MAG: DUF4178 domain-containing protein [Mucilaginibacter sp.]|nr:DUF4178 domain-containing protein [Mucilaginibacter sp.]